MEKRGNQLILVSKNKCFEYFWSGETKCIDKLKYDML